MIEPSQLVSSIILPVVKELNLDRGRERDVVALLLYTVKQESDCGRYIKQLGGGPACGPWQVEKRTYSDCIDNYLKYRRELLSCVLDASYCDRMPPAEGMIGNLYLNCAIARIVYRRCPAPIPKYDDLDGMWNIYKRFYNTL